MLFKVNDANLQHLRDVLEEYPKAWIHGDGNIYVDEEASDFRARFGNPLHNGTPAPAAYRTKFTDVSDVPAGPKALERLERLLMDSKAMENIEDAKVKENTDFKVLKAKPTAAAAAQPDEDLEEKGNYLSRKEAGLRGIQFDLETKGEQLSEKESQLHTAAKNVSAKSAELDVKEKVLAEREAKLKEMEEKLAALQPADKSNPATATKPAANK